MQTPRNLIIVAIVIIASVACGDGPAGKQATQDCSATPKEFLTWYKANYDQVNHIQFAPLTANDIAGYYRVNFDSVAKYQQHLKASGYFSDKFLADQLQYFKTVSHELEKSHQNDGPPEGLEYDLLLYTQEPELWLTDTLQFKPVDGQKGTFQAVSLAGTLRFYAVNKSGKCQIDSIAPITE